MQITIAIAHASLTKLDVLISMLLPIWMQKSSALFSEVADIVIAPKGQSDNRSRIAFSI